MPISLSDAEAARPGAAVPSGRSQHAAAVAASLGVLLVLAGWAVVALGFNVPWMLEAHDGAPGAFAVVAWSSLTVLGLGTSALVLLLAADRGRGTLAALLPLTFAAGGTLTHVPKFLLAEPRPAATAIADKLHVIGHAFTGAVSMPSGHSVTAAATATLLCALVVRRPLPRALVVIVAILVASSRVFVGAHWPGDVIVGLGVGLIVAALALACARWPWHAWLSARIASVPGQCVVALIELLVAAAVLRQDTGYPAGRAMVWLLAAVALASSARRWVDTLQRRGRPADARARPS